MSTHGCISNPCTICHPKSTMSFKDILDKAAFEGRDILTEEELEPFFSRVAELANKSLDDIRIRRLKAQQDLYSNNLILD